LRKVNNDVVSISFDERKTLFDLDELINVFAKLKKVENRT